MDAEFSRHLEAALTSLAEGEFQSAWAAIVEGQRCSARERRMAQSTARLRQGDGDDTLARLAAQDEVCVAISGIPALRSWSADAHGQPIPLGN